MTRALMALLAVTTALPACIAEPAPALRHTEWIVDGTLESGLPAVVIVYNRRGSMCSGTIIAPRIVLTAKHCVQEPGATEPDPPSYFTVGIGNSIRSISQSLTSTQVRTTPGVWTDGRGGLSGALVGIDVGLITLSRGVTDFEPIAVRRESPLDLIGHDAIAVGFGETPSGEVGTKYRTTTRVRGVEGGVIYTDPSTCQGDSGGPILTTDDPPEVFGITSFGTGSCGSGIAGANRVDTFLDLIDEAVGDSGGCLNDGPERCDGFDNDCNDEVDETCTEPGLACSFDDECLGNNCADTPAGRLCSIECDPLRPSLSCPPGLYCARTTECDGLCVPGMPGSLGIDEECTADTDCVTLFCGDPGDGRRRCLIPCRGDAGMCLAGEACAAVPGVCSGCVPAVIVVGARGLGEPCAADGDCRSGACLEDGDAEYCTRPCTEDIDCGSGFHCRDDACVRGGREGVGSGCRVNPDCQEGDICAVQGSVRWCTTFCDGPDDCPDGFSCTPAGGAMLCAPDARLVGEPCMEDADCVTGLCADLGEGTICSRLCGPDAPCTTGFECRPTEDGTRALCLAPVATTATPGGGGCSCAVPDGQAAGGRWAILLLATWVAVVVRRRRR